MEKLLWLCLAVLASLIIDGNPGTDDCDRSIAEAKGWRIFN